MSQKNQQTSGWSFNNYQNTNDPARQPGMGSGGRSEESGAGRRSTTTTAGHTNNARPLAPPRHAPAAPPPPTRTTMGPDMSAEKQGLRTSYRPTAQVDLTSRKISEVRAARASEPPVEYGVQESNIAGRNIEETPLSPKAQERKSRAGREAARRQKEESQNTQSIPQKSPVNRRRNNTAPPPIGGFQHRGGRRNQNSRRTTADPGDDENHDDVDISDTAESNGEDPEIAEYERPGAVAIGHGVEIRRSTKGSLPSQPRHHADGRSDPNDRNSDLIAGEFPIPDSQAEFNDSPPPPEEHADSRRGEDEDSSPIEGAEKASQRRTYYVIGAIVLIVVIVAAVVGGVVAGGGGSSSKDDDGNSGGGPADMITLAPTVDQLKETREILRSEIERFSPDPSILDDVASPQYKALDWLASEFDETFGSNADLDEEVTARRIANRYTLAVLYFATDGEDSWLNESNFLSLNHECAWNYVKDDAIIVGVQCEDGPSSAVITEINLGTSLQHVVYIICS